MPLHLREFPKLAIGGLLLALLGSTIALLGSTNSMAAQTPLAGSRVDLELVVTVDVSLPMDRDEQVVARDGYVEAFRSPEFIDAVTHGQTGRIAVTYVEWSDVQTIVVPWTLIDSSASANALADRLSQAPLQYLRTTSISGDLLFSAGLLDTSGFTSPRRTIDVSGNGPNNDGAPVVTARDAVVAKGITINGLPIDLGRREAVIDNLADYYKECVIGGPEGFLFSVHEISQLPAAIRQKLVQEIAMDPMRDRPTVRLIDAQVVDCRIGEKMGPFVPWFRRPGSLN